MTDHDKMLIGNACFALVDVVAQWDKHTPETQAEAIQTARHIRRLATSIALQELLKEVNPEIVPVTNKEQ